MRRLHPLAGALAFCLIAGFWSATVAVELFGGPGAIVAVKTAILWGIGLLVPALALTGASGFRLACGRGDPSIRAKRRRMPVIALNGLLVLVPSAIFLQARAAAGAFDTAFAAVQAVELVAGAANLVLIGLNLRDGLALTGRWPRRHPA